MTVKDDEEFSRRLRQLDADLTRLRRAMDENEARQAHDLENRVRTERLGLREKPFTYTPPPPCNDSIESQVRRLLKLPRKEE